MGEKFVLYWYEAHISISDTDDGVLMSKYLHYVKKPFVDKCSNTIEGSGVCLSQLLESAQ